MKPALAIFGLGNPGKAYEGTRHNTGFLAIDVLSETFGAGEWGDLQKFLAFAQEARVGVAPVLLCKPKTYMNSSADAIRKIVEFYKLDSKSQVLVLTDDVDLSLGDLRLRMKGGPGTHNGLKSVVEVFGEEVPRIRIGIGPQPERIDLSAWVLSRFSDEERAMLDVALGKLPDMVSEFVMGTDK